MLGTQKVNHKMMFQKLGWSTIKWFQPLASRFQVLAECTLCTLCMSSITPIFIVPSGLSSQTHARIDIILHISIFNESWLGSADTTQLHMDFLCIFGFIFFQFFHFVCLSIYYHFTRASGVCHKVHDNWTRSNIQSLEIKQISYHKYMLVLGQSQLHLSLVQCTLMGLIPLGL